LTVSLAEVVKALLTGLAKGQASSEVYLTWCAACLNLGFDLLLGATASNFDGDEAFAGSVNAHQQHCYPTHFSSSKQPGNFRLAIFSN